jgi:hypothetical protein
VKIPVPTEEEGRAKVDHMASTWGRWHALVCFNSIDEGNLAVLDARGMSDCDEMDPEILYEAEGTGVVVDDHLYGMMIVGYFPEGGVAKAEVGAKIMGLLGEMGVRDPAIAGGPPAEVGANAAKILGGKTTYGS